MADPETEAWKRHEAKIAFCKLDAMLRFYGAVYDLFIIRERLKKAAGL